MQFVHALGTLGMYKRNLGFQQIPFSNKCSPEHLFFSVSAANTFNSLVSAIYANQKLIALTGISGVGKSLLIRRVAAKIHKRCKTLIPDYRFTGFEDFVDYIHANLKLDLACSNGTTKLEQITNLLRAEKSGNSERLVLVVDDAHDLSPDVLHKIIQLCHSGSNSAIQVILVGWELLDSRLARAKFGISGDAFTCSYLLEGLKKSETSDYLEHCLRSAGYNGQQLFSLSAIEQIWQFTEGVPKAINILSGLALLNISIDGANVVTKEIIEHAANHCIFSQKLAVAQPRTPEYYTPSAETSFRIVNDHSPTSSLQQRYQELGIPNPIRSEDNDSGGNIKIILK